MEAIVLWETSGGKLGELPDWYALIHAAKIINVPPWELAGCPFEPGKVPVFWVQWALQYEQARAEVAEELRKMSAQTDKQKAQGIGGTQ